MKGIILAGGTGSRLYPLTRTTSKQLLPIAGLQMIYYPLSVLLTAGIKEISIIVSPNHSGEITTLLDSALRSIDVEISWRIQEKPSGLPEAFTICKRFIGDSNVTLILGDNIFGDINTISNTIKNFKGGGHIFAKKVSNPNIFGVVVINDAGDVIQIIEKPQQFISHYAIPGLYTFDADVVEISNNLRPSKRGELEIVDIHNEYLHRQKLVVTQLSDESVWMDVGTHEAYESATKTVRKNGLLDNLYRPLLDAITQFAPCEAKEFKKRLFY